MLCESDIFGRNQGRQTMFCLQTSVQFSSVTQLYLTLMRPHGLQHARPTNSQSLLKLMSIESVMPSNHLILCRPLLLLPPIPPSIRVFSNESTLHMRWPKYWSFSLGITPCNEHPGLISFRTDWLDPLQSKGLSRVFSNTTVQKPQFFGPHSHPYMTTGKTIALTRRTLLAK